MIIEAIFENLEVKRKLFATIEKQGEARRDPRHQHLEHPARGYRGGARRSRRGSIGLHFFNPVPQMMLVEIVAGDATRPELVARGAAFVRQIDKLPLPVKSAPGLPRQSRARAVPDDAIRCVDEGIAPETIDEAAPAFGMPMGPIELADTVGLDICAAAGKALAGADATPPRRLEELLQAGKLGKKTGEGFYRWVKGKPVKGPSDPVDEELINRVMDPYLDEAKKAVEDGVVADADLADAGLIFGTGFAPFRGGPLNYLQDRGPAGASP